jgi:hypothetical protein
MTCSAGNPSAIVTLAANATAVPKKITIKLTALGSEAETSANITVIVARAPPKPTITNIASNPNPVPFGGASTKLSATVTGASLCTFSTKSTLVSGLPATVACTSGTASATVAVTANSTTKTVRIPIEVVASGPEQSTTKTGTITLAPPPVPAISSYNATPSQVSFSGGPTTLSAIVAHATTCTFSVKGKAAKVISGLPVTVACAAGSASTNVSVAANQSRRTRTYAVTLTATGHGVKVTGTTDITISGVATRPTIANLISSPSPVASTGGQATLSATVTNALDCTFTANSPAVSGLPLTVPCSAGTVSVNVTVPANTRGRDVKYKVKLIVKGEKKKKKATVLIVVAHTHGAG